VRYTDVVVTRIFNQFGQHAKRKELRRRMPTAEKILWSKLKGKQLQGFKFRRQYSVGPYVIDFFCPEARLGIELDGASHVGSEAQAYDKERDLFIRSAGIKLLRFTNEYIYKSLYEALVVIGKALKT